MGRDETIEVQKEILLLIAEVRAGVSGLQVHLDECLAIARETNAILASRHRALRLS